MSMWFGSARYLTDVSVSFADARPAHICACLNRAAADCYLPRTHDRTALPFRGSAFIPVIIAPSRKSLRTGWGYEVYHVAG